MDPRVQAIRDSKRKLMPRYVVQEHHAERAGLHWDFRLEDEDNGMFNSWVSKKLGKSRQRCFLFIPTNPHSEHCAYFEGTYPSGSYGAGPVHIWDQGTYEVIDEDVNERKIYIDGEKLNGVYLLKRKGDGNWLFIETDQEYLPE